MITVNGQIIADANNLSLSAYLSRAGYSLTRIAVERNGDIVPKANYEQTMLQDGDILEIVQFVGGG